jgi:hypothetical protein
MWAVPVLALLPFSLTFAEMYKCAEDGKTVFQDRSCRGSGAAITVAGLSNMKALAKNNLAGETWEQSISTEMQTVTEKYRTLTQTARDRISQLRQDAYVIAKSK